MRNYISGTVFIGATSPATTSKAQNQVTALLRDRHHIRSAIDDDFSIRNLTELGAKPRHILSQFLVEALALSVAGGILGLALGVDAAHQLAARFAWPVLIRPSVVVVAVCFSAMVGIVFGLYPARQASLFDPIEALRYE